MIPQPGMGLAFMVRKWALFNVMYLPIFYILVGAAELRELMGLSVNSVP